LDWSDNHPVTVVRVPNTLIHEGRFAPSPTGDLHLGNLRTALVAWLAARSAGGRFIVRMEDLDRANSSAERAQAQLADLAALGLDWDGDVMFQSDRFDRYREVLASLTAAGLTYPCFCTRREIREAAAAPHGDVHYPGTCRSLSAAEQEERARTRPPAIRLRAAPATKLQDEADLQDAGALRPGETPPDRLQNGIVLQNRRDSGGRSATYVVDDVVAGRFEGPADDVVLLRNDGVPAYQLAVVVDDADQGVTEVVRGDDLLPSTPSQLHLQQLLGYSHPAYLHVPLVLGPDGERLAKRHGAVTLADAGGPSAVLAWLATSLGLAEPGERVTSAAQLLNRYDAGRIPRTRVIYPSP
jgi:glutamyl-tRNA synthetase